MEKSADDGLWQAQVRIALLKEYGCSHCDGVGVDIMLFGLASGLCRGSQDRQESGSSSLELSDDRIPVERLQVVYGLHAQDRRLGNHPRETTALS